jgi:hypothetical protein
MLSPAGHDHVRVKGKISDRVIKTTDPYPDGHRCQLVIDGKLMTRIFQKATLRVVQQYAFEVSKRIGLRYWLDYALDLREDCHAYEGIYLKDVAFMRTLCGDIGKVQVGFVDQLTKIPSEFEGQREYYDDFVHFVYWSAHIIALCFQDEKNEDAIGVLGYWGKAWLAPHISRRFFVRERGDGTYELIGECYVHGIMEGEVMAMEHIPIQPITLA